MKIRTALLTGLLLNTGLPATAAETEIATVAGGCFWCVEKDFEHVEGVISAVSGYTGGLLQNPTYRNHGKHIEAVQIKYDPAKVSYAELVEIFWRSVDPTDAGGQFCDRGNSYTTAIFANSDEQREIATASKEKLQQSGILKADIVTPIRKAGAWTDAEDYHQDYYKKNPVRYKIYRYGCGRDDRIKELWGNEAHKGIS
ncbi:peptide-methionine (S)-S-oxide reductase MsrA [Sneathiella sp. P13V-1]|uniref:peptide-methionine (S)-S-oxide reductase MsrA n=1 Tax=Sneathiella sp. P13V-1 TaxID=2697366 RepID=UPI00187B86D9|nr:peptide-methionine (S)-S-oxide reductase MsrA [Sneathiella sp. P13V-1]MBE7636794.1 peptide-methionine (S)-S-oxide reductase MsrA [Sneathiella sp. P13V-1]